MLNEAITAFDEAIRLNPKDPDVWYNKGIVLHKQENSKKQSRSMMSRCTESKRHSLEQQGSGAAQPQQIEEKAVKAYEEAINSTPVM